MAEEPGVTLHDKRMSLLLKKASSWPAQGHFSQNAKRRIKRTIIRYPRSVTWETKQPRI